MHCFTLTPQGIELGIRLQLDPADQVYAPIGSQGRLVAGRSLRNQFLAATRELREEAERCPLAAEILRDGGLVCEQADIEVTSTGTFLTAHRARHPPGRALMLVAAGDTPLALAARSFAEKLLPATPTPCVVREYRSFPPPGVEVLVDTEEGKLLLLLPDSGFALVKVKQGADPRRKPDYTVSWLGDALRFTQNNGPGRLIRTADRRHNRQ